MKNIIFCVIAISWTIFGAFARAENFSTPQAVFEAYKKAAAEGDMTRYMACTTKKTREMLMERQISSLQMKAEYQSLAGKQYRIEVIGGDAVLYFVPEDQSCPPYFFKKEDGEWKLDLVSMSERIYFDHSNHWHWKDKPM